MTTLQDAIRAMKSFKTTSRRKSGISIADQLLGKYKGIVPKNKNSTQLIRQLRNSQYGENQ